MDQLVQATVNGSWLAAFTLTVISICICIAVCKFLKYLFNR